MLLNDMNIKDKICALRECIIKASTDYNYAITCSLGDDRTAKLNKLIVICDNATELFVVGRINQIEDFDERSRTGQYYSKELDESLVLFPEYSMELKEETTRRIA